jgi:hypothetical protein
LIEELIGTGPKHGGAHFAGGGTNVAGEQFLVFEVHVNRVDKILAVEKTSHCYFNAGDATLQLKYFDLVG